MHIVKVRILNIFRALCCRLFHPGCLVSFELDEPLIESMKKNREFSLRFRMLNDEDAILAKVSLKGFSRAIAKLNPIKS